MTHPVSGTVGRRLAARPSRAALFAAAAAVAAAVLGTPSAGVAQTAAAPTAPVAAPVWLGRFDAPGDPWREQRLKASITPNRFEWRVWDGVPALVVLSQASMSLMARPVELDLQRTPVLCWRWRVDAPLQQADLRTRAGDDQAARLYVSLALPEEDKSLALRAQLRMGRALWGAELPDAALNYVWDNRQPVGTEGPNAYTDRARMIVLRSGAADAGRWVDERRDIAADASRLFGPRARAVQLAVTADTDNTGESARAGFAQLHAVPAGAPCRFGAEAR
jgi:hypothetical protein